MYNNITFEKKYPKSKKGEQCLGPCYEPGTRIIHPHTLDYITSLVKPFCPVTLSQMKDQKTGKMIEKTIDECYIPTQEKDISKKDIEMNILIPQIDFNCMHFLKIYYDIHSFDDALQWIEKKNKSIFTKLRIMECAFIKYNHDIDIIDDRLINFYIGVIKNIWMKDIFSVVKKYLFVENNEIYIKETDLQDADGKVDYGVEKINYFIHKFINPNIIGKFFSGYINKHKNSWEDIKFHNENIKAEFIDYITKKILKTIEA